MESAHTPRNIGPYEIKNKIGGGATGTVFEAADTSSGRTVAVKILSERIDPDSESYLRFKKQAELLSSLEHPHIARFIDYRLSGNQLSIVTERLGGGDLQALMGNESSSRDGKVELMLQAARALDYAHSQGLIHRDLKPGNIALSSKGGEAKLLDFGVAEFMNVRRMFAAPQRRAAGSFAYMAPEQSGILARSVDTRSDLYSLGILFYQLMTGALPYQAEDVGELVHQHIARTPQAPAEAAGGIPPLISDVILKLIKKDPDDRYQSAFGLAEDLAAYLSLEEEQRNTRQMELGKKDRLKILDYRTRLVDRSRELKRLREHMNATVRGKGFTTVVLGKSGIGKTRLVSELQRYAGEKNAVFAEVSSTERTGNQPYYPFNEAVKRVLEITAKMPEERRREIHSSLQRRLGDEGRLLSKVIPELAPILGEYRQQKSHSRPENELFFEKMRDFFLAAASPKHPFILSFDNAHFWDHGSIQLFSYLKRHLPQSSIYLLLMMQEEEIHRVDQLMESVREGRKNGEVEILTLSPLPAEDVGELVSELFGGVLNGLRPLSDRIYESSQGNPLLVIENLKTLVEQDIISRREEGWTVDVSRLEQVQFSSSIADKIDLRLQETSEEVKRVLAYAAVIGREFSLPTLHAVMSLHGSEISREELLDALRAARESRLIEESLAETGEIIYSFVHDNVVSALLEEIPAGTVREIHQRVGEKLESDYQGSDKVYQLAYHYLQAGSRNKAYTYNTKAGRTALESYSFRLAVDFFYHALSILRHYGKDTAKTIKSRIKLSLEIANLDFQLGEYERNIELLNELSELTDQQGDERNLAQAYYLLARNHFFSGNQAKAIEYYYKLISVAEKLNIPELLAIPYCAVGRAQCFMANFSTSIDYIEKGLRLLPKEEVLERVYALGVLAQSYGYIGKKEKAYATIRELEERYGGTTNEMFKLYIRFYDASVESMVGDPQEAISKSEECLRMAREQKNIALELFCNYFLGLAHGFLGRAQTAIREIKRALHIAEEQGISVGVFMVYFNLAEQYALTGQTKKAEETLEAGKKQAELANKEVVGQWELRIRAVSRLTGAEPDYAGALEAIDSALELCAEGEASYDFTRAQNQVVKAAVHQLTGAEEEARQLFERAIGVYRSLEVTSHIDSARRTWTRLTAPEELEEETEESAAGGSEQSGFSYQRQLRYLLRLSEQLSQVHDMDQLLPRIISLALEVSGAERGALFLYEGSGEERSLVLREQQSIQPEERAAQMAYPRVVVEETIDAGRGRLVEDAERELADDPAVAEHAMKSIITVPVITSGRVLGAIYLDNRQVKGLFTEENFELLKAFGTEAAISIENVRLYARVQESAKKEQELQIATDIQTSILPEVEDTESYEMAAYMRTADEVGGDYYDFDLNAEPYFGVFGDVSGHGLQSGLVMMMSEVAFKTVMNDPQMKKKPLPELYQMINTTLYENIQRRLSQRSVVRMQYSHMYMTFRLFRFDDAGNFEMFGNDHAQPLICRAETGEVIPIASRGFLLGILEEAVQGDTSYSFTLQPGDLLVLYSDGITEARREAKETGSDGDGREMFGEEALRRLITEYRGSSPQQIVETVIGEVRQWMSEQEDDITMTVIKRKEE